MGSMNLRCVGHVVQVSREGRQETVIEQRTDDVSTGIVGGHNSVLTVKIQFKLILGMVAFVSGQTPPLP
jgi:hypothetical protein